ncbi:AhpD-like protein [Dipodascopsis uninucleata]
MSPITPSFLSSLRATPLLASSWYYIAAATFSVCNRPDAIPQIYKYAIEHDALKGNLGNSSSIIGYSSSSKTDLAALEESSLTSKGYGTEDESMLVDCANADVEKVQIITKKTREALLKGAALSGLPKAINSLIQLRNATPVQYRDTKVARDDDVNEVERGIAFWNQVYGKVSRRVLSQMDSAYPDLAQYALNNVYAPLLSYTGILSAKETSFVVIACLIPQDVNPQLKGHLRGGLNNGATKEEIMRVRELAIKISMHCGITWEQEVAKLE